MKMSLQMPNLVHQAKDTQKGFNWFVESLIFVVMYFVVKLAVNIIAIPLSILSFFFDVNCLKGMLSGDMDKSMEAITNFAQSDIAMVVSLLATIGMILMPILYCRFLEKRKLSTMGFVKKDMFKEYGLGLLVGFVMFGAGILICVVTGNMTLTLNFNYSPIMLLPLFIGFMVQGMSEEVLCRGYLLVSVSRKNAMLLGVIINSIFFMLLHTSNPGVTPLAFVNLFLFGVFASVYFLKRGNIWGIAAIHTIWNYAQGNIFGVEVSGMRMKTSVLASTVTENGALIHGGSFGLEGGLAVTAVLVIATVIMLFVPSKEDAV